MAPKVNPAAAGVLVCREKPGAVLVDAVVFGVPKLNPPPLVACPKLNDMVSLSQDP